MPITSKTEVCNLALAELGARRINSIDTDTSVEANACRLHLDHVAATLLRRHQWSFATARAELPLLAGSPPAEWSAAFQLPADFVRLIRISHVDPARPVREFALEGRTLLARGGQVARIVYVSSGVPVPHWDPLFIDAVKYKLAAQICGDVTQNPQLAEAALQKLERLALPAAQTADAREVLSGENFGPRQLAAASTLVALRRGGGMPLPMPDGP